MAPCKISLKFARNIMLANTKWTFIYVLTSMCLHSYFLRCSTYELFSSFGHYNYIRQVFSYFHVHFETLPERNYATLCIFFMQIVFYVGICHYIESWFGDVIIFSGVACIICILWASWWDIRHHPGICYMISSDQFIESTTFMYYGHSPAKMIGFTLCMYVQIKIFVHWYTKMYKHRNCH